MKRPIITDLNFLKQKSEVATFWEARRIIRDLEDSLNLKKGLGLTAIQIGIPKRVSIVRIHGLKINLINAEVLDKYDKFRMKREGCLSLPGIFVDTTRFKKIDIINNGKKETYEGLEAIVIQHELDHMTGLIILNRKWRKRK